LENRWTPPICPRCSQVIASDDTIDFVDRHVVHLDCRRHRMLSNEERTLLYRYCFAHSVAECSSCSLCLQQTELAAAPFLGHTHLCPKCRQDVTESIRTHLYGCGMVPAEVRHRARLAREAAQRLVKRTHELVDRADVLMREAESALAVLRETMRQSLKPGDTPTPERDSPEPVVVARSFQSRRGLFVSHRRDASQDDCAYSGSSKTRVRGRMRVLPDVGAAGRKR
jgi:hypothetical protein